MGVWLGDYHVNLDLKRQISLDFQPNYFNFMPASLRDWPLTLSSRLSIFSGFLVVVRVANI